MSSKKQAAGLNALKNLRSKAPEVDEVKTKPTRKVATKPATTSKPKSTPVKKKATTSPSPSSDLKKSKTSFLLSLPDEAHAKLRELAFHENTSMTQLALEGVDYLFESRGLPAIAKPPVED